MGERVQLKRDSLAGIFTSLGLLRKEEDLFDLTLISEDEVKFEAHKVVLSASSAFFKSILKQSSTPHPLLYLGGVTSTTLLSLLDYIYHGEILLPRDELSVFLDVAKKFRIDGLLSTQFSQTAPEKREAKEQVVKTESDLKCDEEKIPIKTKTKKDSWMDQIEGLLFTNSSEPSGENVKEESDEEDLVEELDEDFDEETLKKISETQNVDPITQNMSEIDVKIDKLIEIKDTKKTCRVCGYASMNSGHIREHVELHIEGVSYTCQFCQKTFRGRGNFRRHQKKQHMIQMSSSRQRTHLRDQVEIKRTDLKSISSNRMHAKKYHKAKK